MSYRSHSQAQCYVSIPILVVPLEHVRHAFQANAALHKEVET